MITVCMYGSLAKYGKRFNLHADSPSDALRALFTQIPELMKEVREGAYQVRWKKEDYTEDMVKETFKEQGSGVLHLVPVVAGSGKVARIVLGVVLIAVGFWLGSAAIGMAALGQAAISMGASLLLGGLAELLTKQPKLDNKGKEQSRNTAFSNLDNTISQGKPVPIAYGRVYCGSRVVSQGVRSRRIQTGSAVSAQDPTIQDVTLRIDRQYYRGTPATAPNGQVYNTDFANDSVKARNYKAVVARG